jgi:hypothetical protein
MGAFWDVTSALGSASALGSVWGNNTSSGTVNGIYQAQQQMLGQYNWQNYRQEIEEKKLTPCEDKMAYEDKLAYKFKKFVDQLRYEVDNWLKLEAV